MRRNQKSLSLQAREVRSRWSPSIGSSAIMIVALLAYGLEAQATEGETANKEHSGWSFAISPYLWAAGIKGKSGTLPGLPPADVDESFSDIFDDLKFAGMLIATAEKGRFGIGSDLQYVKTSSGVDAAPPYFDGGKLDSGTFAFSVWGSYVAFDDVRSNLKLAAGARLWSVDTNLKLSGGLLGGTKIDHDETWVDPILGVTARTDIAPKVFLQGWGFAGGFGVGSDIMFDLFGGVGYRFSEKTSTTFGYRWMKVDYDKDGFLYDVRQQGIAAGLTFRF